MRRVRTRLAYFTLGATFASLILLLIYQIPPVKDRLEWRLDAASGILRGWLHPQDTLPRPGGVVGAFVPPTRFPSPESTAREFAPAATVVPPTPSALPTAHPAKIRLPAPEWEKQDWNNCGPATLSLALRALGWDGDQFDISSLIKPDRTDKNVNVDELVYYVRNRAGWLSADYRVAGTIDLLRRFLAAGYPVIVEKGYTIEDGGGGWAGHYLLLTGYDDAQGVLIAQDSNRGADQLVPYRDLDEGWRSFNRVYLYIYPPGEQSMIDGLLGPDADPDANRQRALEAAGRELEDDPEDAYAWFNLGTNLVYFERYGEAAQAFDKALAIGLPWRFTRYQFGPYIAYFHQGRYNDLIDLAEATLARTPNAEESLLWRGWGRYRLGDSQGALEDFRAALAVNPSYQDARYALECMGACC